MCIPGDFGLPLRGLPVVGIVIAAARCISAEPFHFVALLSWSLQVISQSNLYTVEKTSCSWARCSILL